MGDESQKEYEDYLAGIPYLLRLWYTLREMMWQFINKGGN